MTFREKYLAGEIEFEEIDSYVSRWGFDDTTCTLREYLGLTVEGETAWVEDSDEARQGLLGREKAGK